MFNSNYFIESSNYPGIEMKFDTEYTYSSRTDKPRYVNEKYQDILQESVLDVGADQGLLEDELDDSVEYWGIGLGDGVDEMVDLEEDGIPYEDDTYDCVVCLDVLEHVDNIHHVFDELCRVANEHVIISLPNPWASFMRLLRDGYYSKNLPMKFYNLPVDGPTDRHKWFYGPQEAERFFAGRAAKNDAAVVQMDREESVKSPLKRFVYRTGLKIVLDGDIKPADLMSGNVWCLIAT